MNCTILAVGTELLMGQIVNTNAAFLSKELNELGINVISHITIGDNPERLKKIYNFALEFSDLIITTGGLGPTQDDLTKEIIASSFGKELEIHEPSLERIKSYFKRLNRDMSKNNIKQAYLPSESIVLQNNNGTAPGFIIENDNKISISLPGPPREMKGMFFDSVRPYLESKSDSIIRSKSMKFAGIGESRVETVLEDLISSQTNPTLATYAKDGEVTLRITAKGKTEEETQTLIAPVLKEVENRLNEYLYTYDEDTLEKAVVDMLIDNNITISLTESCTGGLLSSKFTSNSGISKVFDRAIVTYSNASKIEELNVDEKIIEEYGAVSEQTAEAMAKGLKDITGTDIAVSITGIAGPTGGTEEKPVGLAYIGIVTNKGTFVKKTNFLGDRNRIRNYITIEALDLIRKTIKKEYNI